MKKNDFNPKNHSRVREAVACQEGLTMMREFSKGMLATSEKLPDIKKSKGDVLKADLLETNAKFSYIKSQKSMLTRELDAACIDLSNISGNVGTASSRIQKSRKSESGDTDKSTFAARRAANSKGEALHFQR